MTGSEWTTHPCAALAAAPGVGSDLIAGGTGGVP
jgi:hypothetical protein